MSSQSYRLVGIAASQPNSVLLREIEPDIFRAELIAIHVIVEDSARQYDRRAEEHRSILVRQLLLPVPLSKYRAGLDVGELANMLDDAFWEVRLADSDAILARLADVFPCGPACRWVTVTEADGDGSTLDFVLDHGDACPETDDDGQPELEAAA